MRSINRSFTRPVKLCYCSNVLGTHPSGGKVRKRRCQPDPEVYLKASSILSFFLSSSSSDSLKKGGYLVSWVVCAYTQI
jgi:hypothetical protein